MNILDKIVKRKKEEIAEAQKVCGWAEMKSQAKAAPACRGFVAALRKKVDDQQPAVIAEIKQASPSKGIICHNFDPIASAESYERAGAGALSVLTDKDFFKGDDAYIKAVKAKVSLPVLRKDFMVDEYHVYQSKALGADCILLIVACLTDQQLSEYHELAMALGMDVLVEVHDEVEMHRALAIKPQLIGVNNRNLKTFEVDLQTTLSLKSLVPETSLLVAESGIHKSEDVVLLRGQGISTFLVGEAFMKTDDPGRALNALFGVS